MDLASMRENGVRSLEITCHQCRHKTVMKVDHLPGDLTVKSFEPRMVCTKCGTIGAMSGRIRSVSGAEDRSITAGRTPYEDQRGTVG
jgi:hypothetical protein